MLLTCRKLYREAIDILYANNTFTFSNPAALLIFSRSVLPRRLSRIRNIIISAGFQSVHHSMEHLERGNLPHPFNNQTMIMGPKESLLAEALASMTSLRRFHFTYHPNEKWLSEFSHFFILPWFNPEVSLSHLREIQDGPSFSFEVSLHIGMPSEEFLDRQKSLSSPWFTVETLSGRLLFLGNPRHPAGELIQFR
ncbi:hypothetical protein M011DRAFT_110587 [Sporormia fimetaria CBS 119925]|uniref:DUF7730 domain-containing protein n=1 Tax=Sporormia fimetaria CBS 119925 TaxID=1340428 RepID=A0A6A6VNK4_9PLEO|nr:hypothetical protein M011DRAFT_110587 [Sporormia fimetaria CBS 119925]